MHCLFGVGIYTPDNVLLKCVAIKLRATCSVSSRFHDFCMIASAALLITRGWILRALGMTSCVPLLVAYHIYRDAYMNSIYSVAVPRVRAAALKSPPQRYCLQLPSKAFTHRDHIRTMTSTVEEKLDRLYPAPSPSPSVQAPRRLPGSTPESTSTLIKVLKDNHVKWHIFFNDKGFHKY